MAVPSLEELDEQARRDRDEFSIRPHQLGDKQQIEGFPAYDEEYVRGIDSANPNQPNFIETAPKKDGTRRFYKMPEGAASNPNKYFTGRKDVGLSKADLYRLTPRDDNGNIIEGPINNPFLEEFHINMGSDPRVQQRQISAPRISGDPRNVFLDEGNVPATTAGVQQPVVRPTNPTVQTNTTTPAADPNRPLPTVDNPAQTADLGTSEPTGTSLTDVVTTTTGLAATGYASKKAIDFARDAYVDPAGRSDKLSKGTVLGSDGKPRSVYASGDAAEQSMKSILKSHDAHTSNMGLLDKGEIADPAKGPPRTTPIDDIAAREQTARTKAATSATASADNVLMSGEKAMKESFDRGMSWVGGKLKPLGDAAKDVGGKIGRSAKGAYKTLGNVAGKMAEASRAGGNVVALEHLAKTKSALTRAGKYGLDTLGGIGSKAKGAASWMGKTRLAKYGGKAWSLMNRGGFVGQVGGDMVTWEIVKGISMGFDSMVDGGDIYVPAMTLDRMAKPNAGADKFEMHRDVGETFIGGKNLGKFAGKKLLVTGNSSDGKRHYEELVAFSEDDAKGVKSYIQDNLLGDFKDNFAYKRSAAGIADVRSMKADLHMLQIDADTKRDEVANNPLVERFGLLERPQPTDEQVAEAQKVVAEYTKGEDDNSVGSAVGRVWGNLSTMGGLYEARKTIEDAEFYKTATDAQVIKRHAKMLHEQLTMQTDAWNLSGGGRHLLYQDGKYEKRKPSSYTPSRGRVLSHDVLGKTRNDMIDQVLNAWSWDLDDTDWQSDPMQQAKVTMLLAARQAENQEKFLNTLNFEKFNKKDWENFKLTFGGASNKKEAQDFIRYDAALAIKNVFNQNLKAVSDASASAHRRAIRKHERSNFGVKILKQMGGFDPSDTEAWRDYYPEEMSKHVPRLQHRASFF